MLRIPVRAVLSAIVFLGIGLAGASAQDPNNPNLPPLLPPQPPPEPIPEVALVGTLDTHPIRRGTPGPNWVVADTTVLPRDRKGIWVLEFQFRPMRMIEVDVPGKGRRRIHYIYYRVVNRTGEPRRFVPQFTLVDDKGKAYEDAVLPQAVKNIQAREAPQIELLGAVSVMGMIPPSTKEGVDDAVYGVALWDNVDFNADSFSVFVRGLSDGYQVFTPAQGKPFTGFKSIRIDFQRPGDARNPHENEIRLAEPPFDWTYYPSPQRKG